MWKEIIICLKVIGCELCGAKGLVREELEDAVKGTRIGSSIGSKEVELWEEWYEWAELDKWGDWDVGTEDCEVWVGGIDNGIGNKAGVDVNWEEEDADEALTVCWNGNFVSWNFTGRVIYILLELESKHM